MKQKTLMYITDGKNKNNTYFLRFSPVTLDHKTSHMGQFSETEIYMGFIDL